MHSQLILCAAKNKKSLRKTRRIGLPFYPLKKLIFHFKEFFKPRKIICFLPFDSGIFVGSQAG
jgi:hypothetical protein